MLAECEAQGLQEKRRQQKVKKLAALPRPPELCQDFLSTEPCFVSPSDVKCLCRLHQDDAVSNVIPANIRLDRSPFVIGRDSTSNVDACLLHPFEEKMISRFHAIFRLRKHQDAKESCWEVFDLQSLNGLFVNGKKISHTILRDGDVVMFGCSSRSGTSNHAQIPSMMSFRFCSDQSNDATNVRQKRSLQRGEGESVQMQKRVCPSDSLSHHREGNIKSRIPLSLLVNRQATSPRGSKTPSKYLDAQCVGGDLVCPICQDYMVACTSLQCSHL